MWITVAAAHLSLEVNKGRSQMRKLQQDRQLTNGDARGFRGRGTKAKVMQLRRQIGQTRKGIATRFHWKKIHEKMLRSCVKMAVRFGLETMSSRICHTLSLPQSSRTVSVFSLAALILKTKLSRPRASSSACIALFHHRRRQVGDDAQDLRKVGAFGFDGQTP